MTIQCSLSHSCCSDCSHLPRRSDSFSPLSASCQTPWFPTIHRMPCWRVKTSLCHNILGKAHFICGARSFVTCEMDLLWHFPATSFTSMFMHPVPCMDGDTNLLTITLVGLHEVPVGHQLNHGAIVRPHMLLYSYSIHGCLESQRMAQTAYLHHWSQHP